MPEVLRETKPKARKAHACSACFGAIQQGATYTRTTCLYDGRVYDWLTCEDCAKIAGDVADWVHDFDEGYGPDDFEEWAREHREHPGALAYLARRFPEHTDGV